MYVLLINILIELNNNIILVNILNSHLTERIEEWNGRIGVKKRSNETTYKLDQQTVNTNEGDSLTVNFEST